jgi:hypothetical protein
MRYSTLYDEHIICSLQNKDKAVTILWKKTSDLTQDYKTRNVICQKGSESICKQMNFHPYWHLTLSVLQFILTLWVECFIFLETYNLNFKNFNVVTVCALWIGTIQTINSHNSSTRNYQKVLSIYLITKYSLETLNLK